MSGLARFSTHMTIIHTYIKSFASLCYTIHLRYFFNLFLHYSLSCFVAFDFIHNYSCVVLLLWNLYVCDINCYFSFIHSFLPIKWSFFHFCDTSFGFVSVAIIVGVEVFVIAFFGAFVAVIGIGIGIGNTNPKPNTNTNSNSNSNFNNNNHDKSKSWGKKMQSVCNVQYACKMRSETRSKNVCKTSSKTSYHQLCFM